MNNYVHRQLRQRISAWLLLSFFWLGLVPAKTLFAAEVSSQAATVGFELRNDAVSLASGAAWTGDFAATAESQTTNWQEGLTAKAALEQYAAEQGFAVAFADAGFGPYLAEIAGLNTSLVPEGADWSGWTYTVNGVEAWVGLGDYVLEPGDQVAVHFQTGWPAIDVAIRNEVLTVEQGAPWSGELAEIEYMGEIYYSLPGSLGLTARQALEMYAANNGIQLGFTTSPWGEYLSEVNGLGDTIEVSGAKWPGWLFTVNGESPTVGLDDYVLQPGDVLDISFAVTWEELTEPTTAPAGETTDVTGSETGGTTTAPTTATESGQALPELAAEWPSFRGSSANLAVRPLGALTPRTGSESELLWTARFGDPVNFTGFAGQPIIVDGELWLVHGRTLEAFDLNSGASLRSRSLPASQGYASTAPLYADGRLFIPLDGGRVLALRADNWETLWLYEDSLGGQAQNPFAYADGVLYAAFWQKGSSAQLTALGAESGAIIWQNTVKDGFYWAGAAVSEDCLILGGEDGFVSVYDRADGRVLARESLGSPVRSSVVSDGTSYYVISNQGHLLRFQLDPAGAFSAVSSLELGSPVSGTPVVYNGRLYVGSVGIFYVVDLASWQVARTISLPGYAQGSPLLAHEGTDTYLYTTVNQLPGALYVIHDEAGAAGDAEAEALYLPEAAKSGYSLSSPIMSDAGVLYYRNDSGSFFAVQRLAAGATETTTPVPEESTVTGALTGETENPDSLISEGQIADDETLPKTGEDSQTLLIAIVMLGLAGLLIVVLLVRRRKTKDAADEYPAAPSNPATHSDPAGPSNPAGPADSTDR